MNEPLLGNQRFRFDWEVTASDLDALQHVNNLQYLRWCLKAAVAHSAHVGWSSERYHESGYGFIVREHQIKYRLPAVLGDQVVIETWIATMERVASTRRYHVLRKSDGRRLAEAETKWVYVNLRTLELTRIPVAIQQAFAQND